MEPSVTQEGFKRKLTAILSADVAGYSRLMGEDEEATVRTITAYREVLTTLIQQHNGKVLDSPGDNLLAEFVSVVNAVQCAVAVQKEIKAHNDELPEKPSIAVMPFDNMSDDPEIDTNSLRLSAKMLCQRLNMPVVRAAATPQNFHSKLPVQTRHITAEYFRRLCHQVFTAVQFFGFQSSRIGEQADNPFSDEG